MLNRIVLFVFLITFNICNAHSLKTKTFFRENFQEYQPQYSPFENNWDLQYSGIHASKQVVVQEASNKFLHLEGFSFWSANAVKSLEESPKEAYLEFYLRCNNLLGIGNKLKEMAAAGFYNEEASKWGYIFAGVRLDWNGDIVFGQLNTQDNHYKKVGTWKSKKWYKFKIYYDSEKQKASLWIDDSLMCKDFVLPPTENKFNSIILKGGNGANRTFCDYDDVHLYNIYEVLSLSDETAKGEELYKQKKYSQAIDVFKKIEKYFPHNVRNLGNLSIAYLKNGEKIKCREKAFQALDLTKISNEERAACYYNLGLSYQNKPIAQSYYYRQSFRLNPLPFLEEKLKFLPEALFYDDFDFYYLQDSTVWEQSKWSLVFKDKEKDADSLQDVSTECFISGDHSLKLVGDTSAPTSVHRFLEIKKNQIIMMSVWVKTKNFAKSEEKDSETNFGFYKHSKKGKGYYFAGISFKNNNQIYFGSSAQKLQNRQLMRWKPETWYKIEIQYNVIEDIGSVKINDKPIAKFVSLENAFPPSANSICLQNNNNSKAISYFDDICVFQKNWSNLFKK